MKDIESHKNTELSIREGFTLPRIISQEGRKAQGAFINFFTATIENKNTAAPTPEPFAISLRGSKAAGSKPRSKK